MVVIDVMGYTTGLEEPIDPQVPEMVPLSFSSGVAEPFRYLFVYLPTFHPLYFDELKQLMHAGYHYNYLFPMRSSYAIMGFH